MIGLLGDIAKSYGSKVREFFTSEHIQNIFTNVERVDGYNQDEELHKTIEWAKQVIANN